MPEKSLKDKIIDLLISTGRERIELLIKYLDDGGFFRSPASTKYHSCRAPGSAGILRS